MEKVHENFIHDISNLILKIKVKVVFCQHKNPNINENELTEITTLLNSVTSIFKEYRQELERQDETKMENN